MIHAFLWIKKKTKNRSKHDPNFWTIANEINSSFKCDYQRPPDGYRITDQHEFHDEADTYTVHQWMSESSGELTKTEMSLGPSSDCLQKTSNEGGSDKFSCQNHRYNKSFSGQYNKVDFFGLKGKRKDLKGSDVKGNDRDARMGSDYATQRTRREIEDKSKRKLTQLSSEEKKYSQKYRRTNYRNKLVDENSEGGKFYRRKRELTLIIPWLDVCTDEGSEEDLEPLLNTRSGKRMKLLKELQGRRGEQIGFTHQEAVILD